MKALRTFSAVVGLCVLHAFAPAASAAPPDERDRQVLETLLLHLLGDPKLEVTGVPTNGATIVLHIRTPQKTGFLMSGQIHSDIGNHTTSAGDQDHNRQTQWCGTPSAADAGRR